MSPAWIGVAIGATGLILGFTYFWLGRKPKRIHYQITADQGLVSRGSRLGWADLSVTYAGKPLTEPRVLTILFHNAGKVEARKEDFDEPLSVAVEGGEVVDSYLVFQAHGETRSERLQPAEQSSNLVSAAPLLLNPGDLLEFRLLVDGRVSTLIKGRIAGCKLLPQPERDVYRSILGSLIDGVAAAALPGYVGVGKVIGTSLGVRAGPPDPE